MNTRHNNMPEKMNGSLLLHLPASRTNPLQTQTAHTCSHDIWKHTNTQHNNNSMPEKMNVASATTLTSVQVEPITDTHGIYMLTRHMKTYEHTAQQHARENEWFFASTLTSVQVESITDTDGSSEGGRGSGIQTKVMHEQVATLREEWCRRMQF